MMLNMINNSQISPFKYAVRVFDHGYDQVGLKSSTMSHGRQKNPAETERAQSVTRHSNLVVSTS